MRDITGIPVTTSGSSPLCRKTGPRRSAALAWPGCAAAVSSSRSSGQQPDDTQTKSFAGGMGQCVHRLSDTGLARLTLFGLLFESSRDDGERTLESDVTVVAPGHGHSASPTGRSVPTVDQPGGGGLTCQHGLGG